MNLKSLSKETFCFGDVVKPCIKDWMESSEFVVQNTRQHACMFEFLLHWIFRAWFPVLVRVVTVKLLSKCFCMRCIGMKILVVRLVLSKRTTRQSIGGVVRIRTLRRFVFYPTSQLLTTKCSISLNSVLIVKPFSHKVSLPFSRHIQ
jgi:hypothetical protein